MPDPSPSTLTVLNSNSEGMLDGHSGQFTPGGHQSAAIHTTLAGIEPTTFWLLVWRNTSCANETTKKTAQLLSHLYESHVLTSHYELERSVCIRTKCRLKLSLFSIYLFIYIFIYLLKQYKAYENDNAWLAGRKGPQDTGNRPRKYIYIIVIWCMHVCKCINWSHCDRKILFTIWYLQD